MNSKEQELDALKPAVLAELTALQDRPPLLLEMTATDGWLLFCAVQLSLRHPQNTGPSSIRMRDFANRLLARLRPGPALDQLAELGWDDQYDVKSGDVETDNEGDVEADWHARKN